MSIKNLVIAGGGATGFISYGAIKQMNILNFWNYDTLNTIYGSSIGSFIGFVVSLGYDWETLDSYIINRPWDKAFTIIKTDLLEIYKNKGLNGEEIVKICTGPLLRGKFLSENITLLELYNATNIELCLVTTEVNLDKCVKTEILSYKTAPNMSVNKAIAASLAFPLLFQPVVDNNKMYIDGGLLHNYPLQLCLNDTKCNEDEILAITNIWTSSDDSLINKTSFIDFGAALIGKCHWTLESSKFQPKIKNQIESIITIPSHNLMKWWEILENVDERTKLINQGINDANTFFRDLN